MTEISPKIEKRSPIVVVMGHVDHGKTSLLDFIRSTKVASREAGGITQSIGAYEIEVEGKKITFIDTPGHEAFSKMRTRGATAADLAILVVAADDGVKPQTKESIQILQSTKTPFVVAINKIDKNNANIEGTKNDLMQNGVYLEGAGGNVSWQPISAKSGEGVKELLDLVLLAADLENLEYNPLRSAKGVVIEAKMDSRRGLAVAVVIKDGVLKTGDEIKTLSANGKVKILEDFLGQRVNELRPSSPALIMGFEKLPQVGEEFFAGETEVGEFEPILPEEYVDHPVEEKIETKLKVVIRADVSGSLEAFAEIIKAIPGVEILDKSVGDIADSDVKTAIAGKAIILGFRSKVGKTAENLAKANRIEVITSEIIYELIKKVEDKVKGVTAENPSAILDVLAVFGKKDGKRQVIGGIVLEGILKNYSEIEVKRNDQILGKGKIINLQRSKEDAPQVEAGDECGLLIEFDIPVIPTDKILTF